MKFNDLEHQERLKMKKSYEKKPIDISNIIERRKINNPEILAQLIDRIMNMQEDLVTIDWSNLITEIINENKMRIEDLSRLIGVSKQTLTKIENKITISPSYNTRMRILLMYEILNG